MKYLILPLLLACCSSGGFSTVEEAICAACKADIERRHNATAENYNCKSGPYYAVQNDTRIEYYLTGTKWYSRYHAYEIVNMDTLKSESYRLELISDGEASKPGEAERLFEEMMENQRQLNAAQELLDSQQ